MGAVRIGGAVMGLADFQPEGDSLGVRNDLRSVYDGYGLRIGDEVEWSSLPPVVHLIEKSNCHFFDGEIHGEKLIMERFGNWVAAISRILDIHKHGLSGSECIIPEFLRVPWDSKSVVKACVRSRDGVDFHWNREENSWQCRTDPSSKELDAYVINYPEWNFMVYAGGLSGEQMSFGSFEEMADYCEARIMAVMNGKSDQHAGGDKAFRNELSLERVNYDVLTGAFYESLTMKEIAEKSHYCVWLSSKVLGDSASLKELEKLSKNLHGRIPFGVLRGFCMSAIDVEFLREESATR